MKKILSLLIFSTVFSNICFGLTVKNDTKKDISIFLRYDGDDYYFHHSIDKKTKKEVPFVKKEKNLVEIKFYSEEGSSEDVSSEDKNAVFKIFNKGKSVAKMKT